MNIGCILENNMERKIVKFKVPAVKHRAHYALFAEDSPFKPKVVKCKNQYRRKPKHVCNDGDWE
jgi:hypothetical protein